MQNFTLRGRRIKWFFFSFLLFVGTIPSIYGQCPTVTDPAQSFCNALSTVSDLQPTGATWYADETSDEPLPSDELLMNGEDYYADSEDCTTPRSDRMVTVTLTGSTSAPNVQDDFFTPCSGGGPYDIADLKEAIDADPAPGAYTLEVFQTRYTAGETPLSDGATITEGNYYVGYTNGSGCETRRKPVRFEPVEAPAPAATSPQTVCEGTTISELEAEGTNLWYRTETSEPALPDDYLVQNNETYWATQIVPSDGPPCESEERTAVTVIVEPGPDAGADNVGVVCEADVSTTFPSNDAVEDFYLALLDDGVPHDGTFNPTIEEIVDQYNSDADGLGDFTTTYTIGSTGCEDSVELTIRIIEEEPANAGSYDDISGVCADDDSIDLTSLTNNDPDATSGGTFSGEGVSDNEFDPSIGEGEYTITYTVDETSEPCTSGSDSTTFTISVDEANAGDDITETVCSSEIEDPELLLTKFSSYLEGRDTDGTFDPDLSTLYAQYQSDLTSGNLPQTYEVTYTVTDGSCEDEATISLTVNPSPEAGEDGTANLESSDDPVELFDYLGGNPDTGGTWSPGDGTFDPATDEPGTFTYTVTNSFECEDSATVTVTVDEECAGVTAGSDNTGAVCETDVQQTFPNNDKVRDYYLGLLDAGVPTNGTFNPTIQQIIDQYQADEDGLGDFTTTYTINVDGCEDSADLTISIVAAEPAKAGEDVDLTFCTSGDDENLFNYLIEEASTEGTFEGYPDGIFSPSQEGAGTYTITYTVDESTGCVTGSDTATFTIEVNEGDANAGEDGTVELAPTDDPVDLFDFLGGTPDEGGTWSPGDGTFDPATDTPGTFTYTVSDGPCEDSATVTVTLTSEECDAGSDNTGVVCETDVQETFSNNDKVREYYLGLLDAGVPTNGTFNPTIQQIINQYQADEDGLGDFTTTYTINVDGCEDSAELTVRITEEEPANAGSFDDITNVCSDEEPMDLTELMNNDPEASTEGTFSGEGVTDNEFDPSIGEGTYTITYTVDDSANCVTEETSDSTTFTITVEDTAITASISATLCVTDARDLISNPAEGIAYLNTLLTEAGVEDFDTDNFSDGATEEALALFNFIENPTSDSQTFSFEYTDPSTSSCGDTVIAIDITITEERDANAGTIDDQTVCSSEGMIDLNDFLGDDSVPGGTFTGTGVTDNMFDASIGPNDGGYEITYTIDDSADCVAEGTSDSTTFIISVESSASAGSDNSTQLCELAVDETFPNVPSVRNFYLALLDDEVATNGTFSPTISQIINDYNADEDGLGDFSTTYTVADGNCQDSALLTLTIIPASEMEIGAIEDQSVCTNNDAFDLFNLLPEGTDTSGSFEGYAEGIFDPLATGEGSFEINYRVEGADCSLGEASFTITVSDGAFAGEDMDLNVCMSDDVQNLFDFLSVNADTNGEFTLDGEVIADGMMDPSQFEAGTYEVIYTVPEENDCGDDSATFNITVDEAPAAPEVNSVSFCAIQSPTGADLIAENEDLTFYSDAELSMMVVAEDDLVAGTYYVTQRNEAGCESDAAEVDVTINDPGTPTIEDATPAFCEYDDATIADLNDAVDQTANVTWYTSADGTESLSTGTALQDGTTYYASLYDPETDCDSSARLEVTVTIEDCPLLFPEGVSPNGDGLNDTFDIENIEREYPNYNITIHNRWGDVIYKGNANTPDWDGTANQSGTLGDDVLPVGVYFYLLDFNDGVTAPRRGKIYLSR